MPLRNHTLYFCWGVGSLGTTAMIAAITFLGLYYLIEVLGLTPAVAGIVVFVGKALDFVAYPAMGAISDRTRSPWGRRRPYLLAGAVACGLAFILVFSLPLLPSLLLRSALAVGALAFYALALVIFFVPYMAQPADLIADPRARNSIMAYRSAFLMIGTLVGSALTTTLVGRFGGGADGYRGMSLIVGPLIALSMLVVFFGTAGAPNLVATASRPSIGSLRSIGDSRPFLVLTIINFLQFLGMAAGSGVILFYVTLVLKRPPQWLGLYGAAIIATSLAMMPLWLYVAARWGKPRTFGVAITGYTFVLMTWLLGAAQEPMGVFVLRAIGIGMFSGGLLVSSQSMVLDAIADDRRRSGIPREAMLMSLYALSEKIAGALGPLVVGFILSFTGFEAHPAPGMAMATTARLGLDVAMAWIMVFMTVASLGLLRLYRPAPEPSLSLTRAGL